MTKVKMVLDDLSDDERWALAQTCKRMTWIISAGHRPTRRSAMPWTPRR